VVVSPCAAEAALRALTGNPDRAIRNEARFRLAKLLAGPLKRKAEAAVLLRHILDEQPNAAPVRLELARLDAEMGHMGAAGRELRAAQAIGLPPEVSRAVRFYQQALDAMRPIGGSIEVAIAPDSNVNRATSASSLNTVIGDFALSRDAQATSGIGVVARGQTFARMPLDPQVTLLARLSGRRSAPNGPPGPIGSAFPSGLAGAGMGKRLIPFRSARGSTGNIGWASARRSMPGSAMPLSRTRSTIWKPASHGGAMSGSTAPFPRGSAVA
jgi:hypothetical protein